MELAGGWGHGLAGGKNCRWLGAGPARERGCGLIEVVGAHLGQGQMGEGAAGDWPAGPISQSNQFAGHSQHHSNQSFRLVTGFLYV